MALIVVGVSHHTAPVDVLERLAVPADLTSKALTALSQREPVTEAAVLSTCNRVEVYADVTRYHAGMAALRDHLAEWGGFAPEDIAHLLYDHYGAEAASHLFAVAGGLESMIVGERQIHGQVRQAFRDALDEGTARTTLNRAFRQAIRVGRRVRTETAISDGAASIVDVGLATATAKLTDPTVLLVGAGKIGGMTARRIRGRAARLLVTNRTPEKAELLAEQLGGEIHPPSDLVTALAQADLAVCSTDAARPVVDVDTVRAALARRPGRGLVFLDLAVPRDVAPPVRDLPGVEVIDIDTLRAVVSTGPTGDAVAAARSIVAQEAADYEAWLRGRAVGPTIAALRQRAEEVRATELSRVAPRLRDLDERQREAVEALTRGIVNTLLHDPSVRLKDAPHHVAAIRELFSAGDDADAE